LDTGGVKIGGNGKFNIMELGMGFSFDVVSTCMSSTALGWVGLLALVRKKHI
jgi:hypothetical protein